MKVIKIVWSSSMWTKSMWSWWQIGYSFSFLKNKLYFTLIIPPSSAGPSCFNSEALKVINIKFEMKVIKILWSSSSWFRSKWAKICDQDEWDINFHHKKIKLIYLTLIIPPTSAGSSCFKSEALNILVIKIKVGLKWLK